MSTDLAEFVGADRGEDFFSGAWGWFALVVVFVVFNTVLGEELLFRGLLLPRMRETIAAITPKAAETVNTTTTSG